MARAAGPCARGSRPEQDVEFLSNHRGTRWEGDQGNLKALSPKWVSKMRHSQTETESHHGSVGLWVSGRPSISSQAACGADTKTERSVLSAWEEAGSLSTAS